MAVSDDILATYRRPKAVIGRLLSGAADEGRALAYLIAALVVAYVAQWPGLSRAAHLDPSQPLTQRMVGSFLAILAMLPLFYAVAALSHIIARAFGGRGSYFRARISLFWALLATSPLMLLQGLATGFAGAGPGVNLLGAAVFAVFLWFWFSGLRLAEFGELA
ncbi:MAG: YIP1 family protein [Paracoccaceae bacterium]